MADPIIQVELDLDQKKFENKLKGVEKTAEATGSNIGAKLVAGIAVAVGAFKAFDKAIKAAITQQNAINDLNRSLAASGQYSIQASKSFQTFASSLQNASTFGDEVILQNAALIQSLGKLDQQGLKRATQAAADLSSALGIDLRSASQLVGKAAAGEVSSFSRYGLIIQKGANNAETFANALNKLEGAFGGAAASKLNTFDGQLKKVQNSFGDILEGFGALITNSPTLLAVFKVISGEFAKLATKAGELSKIDLFSIDSLVSFANAFNDYIIAPFELVYNVAKIVFNYINTTAAAIVAGVGQIGGRLGDLLSALNVKPELAQNLKDFADSSLQVFDENQQALKESYDNVFNGTIYGKASEFASTFRTNLEAAKSEIEASGIKNALVPDTQEVAPDFFSNYSAGFMAVTETAAQAKASIIAFGKESRQALINGFASGATSAFSAFGSALAKGENAISAFGKALLAGLANMVTQLGQMFILKGIAYSFDPLMGGPAVGGPLIAAGAALATFGGVLSAIGGGGGSGVSGASLGSDIGGTGTTAGFATSQERVEPQTAVNVTIQGSVFDSDETGLRIANILKENSINNNVRATVFA